MRLMRIAARIPGRLPAGGVRGLFARKFRAWFQPS